LHGCDSSPYTGTSVGESEMSFLEWVVLGNSIQNWLRTLLVTAAALVALRIAERVVIRSLAAFAKGTKMDVGDYVAAVGQRQRSTCWESWLCARTRCCLSFPRRWASGLALRRSWPC